MIFAHLDRLARVLVPTQPEPPAATESHKTSSPRPVERRLAATRAYSWLLAALLPTALIYTALANPVEELAPNQRIDKVRRADLHC